MVDRWRSPAVLLLAAILSACAGGGAAVPLPPAQRPAGDVFRPPQVQRDGDAGGVLGADAAALGARFGEPRIDLAEGDARKLQFAGEACVLDIYLYPLREGGVPVATHVQARLRQGGGEIPREACIEEIGQ